MYYIILIRKGGAVTEREREHGSMVKKHSDDMSAEQI